MYSVLMYITSVLSSSIVYGCIINSLHCWSQFQVHFEMLALLSPCPSVPIERGLSLYGLLLCTCVCVCVCVINIKKNGMYMYTPS